VFQEGNYNVLEFNPPTQGMNRNIAPQMLPEGFASALENILPTPIGSATVRYGTRLMAGMNLPPDASIMEAFPFAKANGESQIVLYVQTFARDMSIDQQAMVTPNSFRFQTNQPYQFNTDTPVKVSYTHNGESTLYSNIVTKAVAGQTVTITVEDNSFPNDGVTITAVFFSTASLYVYDLKTQTLSNLIRKNLSVGCVPRSVTFLNTLLICNGVDKVLSWNGEHLEEVVDFVKETTVNNFNRVDDTHFTIDLIPAQAANFNIEKYQPQNKIQLKIQGTTTTYTVANVEINQNNVVTLTTAAALPVFDHPPELFYRDWPPAFSFMMVAHSRLWALGVGAVGLNYRDPDQALRVYFSYKPATVTNWFNEVTKTVPSLDLSISHGSPDNLEAIAYLNGLMAFIGRHKTQVWTGSQPLKAEVDPEKPKFEFSCILPVGIAHGNLVVETPNDIYFVSQNGVLSFGTLNVAKQFAASSNDAVDPLVREYVTSTATSNQAYRACRAFKYQSFCGFKIGLNKVLVSLYSTNLYAWSLFSGDFAKATSFLATNALYLMIGNKIFQYADVLPVYGDNDGKDLINFLWSLPVVHLKGKRFANKRYEINCDYPSSFVITPNQQISIIIDGDLSKTFMLQDIYSLQFKGDSLAQIPLFDSGILVEDPNALGFRLDKPYAFLKGRLKFLSSSFTVNLVGTTLSGPIHINKIRLFGIAER
jgi:hypothetical protein